MELQRGVGVRVGGVCMPNSAQNARPYPRASDAARVLPTAGCAGMPIFVLQRAPVRSGRAGPLSQNSMSMRD